ncbi:hypothetical protein FRC11_011069, partial [Ceratobasidium sp. 423]
SPNDMSKMELEMWYSWLLASQSGCLRNEQVFRFCWVSIGQNKGFLDYPQPIRSRPDVCNLVWSPEEKLYAKKVQNIAEDARNQTSWNDLPLA